MKAVPMTTVHSVFFGLSSNRLASISFQCREQHRLNSIHLHFICEEAEISKTGQTKPKLASRLDTSIAQEEKVLSCTMDEEPLSTQSHCTHTTYIVLCSSHSRRLKHGLYLSVRVHACVPVARVYCSTCPVL